MPRTLLVSDIVSMRVWTQDTSLEQQACVTTFDFSIGGGTFVSGMTDLELVGLFDNAIAPSFKACLANEVAYRGTQITYRNVTPLPATQSSIINAGVGTGGVGIAPTQVRGIVKRQTLFAGRKYRGRVYMPFVPIPAITIATGQPTNAYVTALTSMIFAAAPFAGQTFTYTGYVVQLFPVLWHRGTVSFSAIQGYTAETLFATQRKSGAFGRPNVSPI